MNKIKHFIAIIVATISMNAFANETIKIAWPFGQNVTILRMLVDNANREQAKYTFVIEMKPGGSGDVAANYTLSNPTNTLMLTSTSFIIKQLTPPDDPATLDKFAPVYITQSSIPLVVVSKEFKTVNDMLRKKDINIGISAAGGITDILVRDLLKGSTGQSVPFRGLVASINATVAGHVDAGIGTIADTNALVEAGMLNVLGSTGTRGPKPFNKKQFPTMEKLTTSYVMYASVNMPVEKQREMHQILTSAGLNNNVRDLVKLNNADVPYYTFNQTQQWYTLEKKHWKSTVNK